jgi:hypothetical protein
MYQFAIILSQYCIKISKNLNKTINLFRNMAGGDISKRALLESFNKIKIEISRLNNEIFKLKSEYK